MSFSISPTLLFESILQKLMLPLALIYSSFIQQNVLKRSPWVTWCYSEPKVIHLLSGSKPQHTAVQICHPLFWNCSESTINCSLWNYTLSSFSARNSGTHLPLFHISSSRMNIPSKDRQSTRSEKSVIGLMTLGIYHVFLHRLPPHLGLRIPDFHTDLRNFNCAIQKCFSAPSCHHLFKNIGVFSELRLWCNCFLPTNLKYPKFHRRAGILWGCPSI